MKIGVNARRADLGLPQFDLPPAEPVFSPNPLAELVIANTDGRITLKLRVPTPPAQYTLVQGPAPVRTGVRCVQHFPFLGLLPPPTDGWSDITELYVARYGVPKASTAIWIRTCQHIDGWQDVPKVARARVLAAASRQSLPRPPRSGARFLAVLGGMASALTIKHPKLPQVFHPFSNSKGTVSSSPGLRAAS